MGAFETTHREVVFTDGQSTLRNDTIATPDGDTMQRRIALRPPACAIVPITDDGKVVLISQYRHPLGRESLEIPGGILDPTPASLSAYTPPTYAPQVRPDHAGAVHEREAIQTGMVRELYEETGFDAQTITPLCAMHTSVGWCDEIIHIGLAQGLTARPRPARADLAPEERDITLTIVSLEEASAMITSGRITDAKTIAGILMAKDHLANKVT